MNRINWAVVLSVVLLGVASANAEKKSVTIQVTCDTLPEPKTVYISGDCEALGDWKADVVPLDRQDDGSWTKTFPFNEGDDIEFKITRGDWALEAVNADGSIPANTKLRVTGDKTVHVHVAKWRDEAVKPQGQITGKVVYHRRMEAEGLLPRDVLVWLPPGYDTAVEKRYPVLYMHDGQQVFDPATSTWGIDWQVDETATKLIAEGKMKEIIVVAAACTKDRFEEYATTPKGELYRKFLIGKLKPFIDQTYRTLPDRENTAVMGSSMGGLASFLLAWYRPDVFSMAGCLSPAFRDTILREVEAYDGPPKNVKIYMDNGGVGLERDLQVGTDRMLELLPKKGFVFGRDLVWFQDLSAEHNEAAWAARVNMPLLYFFGVGPQEWIVNLPPPPRPIFADRDGEPVVFESLPAFRVIGLAARMPWRDPEKKLREAWGRLLERKGQITAPRQPEAPEFVGIDLDPWREDADNYIAGVIVTEECPVPPGMLATNIAANRYLVLEHDGLLATADVNGRYFRDWWILHRPDRKGSGPTVNLFEGPPDLKSGQVKVRGLFPVK